jgi:hypothetical protein
MEETNEHHPSVDVTVSPSENQTGFPEDTQEEIKDDIPFGEQITKEVAEPTPEPVEEVAQTDVQEQTPVAQEEATEVSTPEVPKKFQDDTGQIDVEKVVKSTMSAEEALQKYRETEKELRQKQNEAHRNQSQPLPQQPGVSPLDVLSQQIGAELQRNGTEKGLANLLLEVKQLAVQEARSQMEGEISNTNERLTTNDRQKELEAIAQQDPEVFSPQTYEAIQKTLRDKPYLLQSKTPFTDAYFHMKGQRQAQNGQVNTPKPKSTTAPATPVGGVRNVAPQVEPKINLDDTVQLNKYLDTLPQEKQDEFWAKRGINKKWIY